MALLGLLLCLESDLHPSDGLYSDELMSHLESFLWWWWTVSLVRCGPALCMYIYHDVCNPNQGSLPIPQSAAAVTATPTMSRIKFIASILLVLPTLGHAMPNPPTIVSGTDQITCFFPSSGFVSNSAAATLVSEFNRIVCQNNPAAPISLQPLESIIITDPGSGTIIFQNTKDMVATPPSCGEVVEDFQTLLNDCFSGKDRYSNGGSVGGLLVETAGGGATNYIIKSP
jgi:hypothetical protein